MKSMSMTVFIRNNREEIDNVINQELFRYDGNGGRGTIPCPPPRRNDDERRRWVLNNESLYLWARSEGVNV
ncbi:MAG TPA: hypothetical protein PLW50_01070 [Smithellaceae bacterium]|nr:hypothetical protein [Smithellaceae bacterium]